jgi:hypothetical protein
MLEAESTPQDHSAIGKILCQWKIPMTPAGIEPATLRFVSQHLNYCATTVTNRNEYQEYFFGGKGGRCAGLTTIPSLWAVSWNLEALTSWKHLSLPRPLTGLLLHLPYLQGSYYHYGVIGSVHFHCTWASFAKYLYISAELWNVLTAVI